MLFFPRCFFLRCFFLRGFFLKCCCLPYIPLPDVLTFLCSGRREGLFAGASSLAAHGTACEERDSPLCTTGQRASPGRAKASPEKQTGKDRHVLWHNEMSCFCGTPGFRFALQHLRRRMPGVRIISSLLRIGYIFSCISGTTHLFDAEFLRIIEIRSGASVSFGCSHPGNHRRHIF